MRQDAIPFETFARWNRIDEAGPLFASEPGEWAAAAHAIVVGDTVEYLWGRRSPENAWVVMHSSAPAHTPWKVEHDPRNPVVTPGPEGHFDD